MSVAAGRQNGLLEAGSCGKALISTNCGVARELINHGSNGFIVERTRGDLEEALVRIVPYVKNFGLNIRKEVVKRWSWKIQAKTFEDAFNEFWEIHHGKKL
jgi:glycosyltransferase involved in cell wall biosynthesis